MRPSQNLVKLRRQVAKLKQREQRRRQQARHTYTSMIIDRAQLIGIEQLATRNMTTSAAGTVDAPGRNVAQKTGLNRSILEIGWHEIDRQLGYKANWAGRAVQTVPAANTSRRCSRCGHTDAANRVTQSRFECQSCGYQTNADTNAAINIEQLARQRTQPPDTG